MNKLKLLVFSTVLGITSLSAQTVVVSSGNPVKTTASSTVWRKPLSSFYGYERTAYIYKQSEIGATGTINQIGFYCDSVNAPVSVPVVVYMKETTASSFAASSSVATEETGATLVYTGTVTASSFVKGQWVTLNLTTPFVHASSNNVEVIVECSGGGSGVEGYLPKGFRYDSLSTSNMQYWYQDNTPPTGLGNLSNYRQNIRLIMTPLSACSGTPTSGTVTGTSSICYNTSTQLALTGYSIASGISYQWQSSPNGSTWTNVPGATTTIYTTPSLTTNTYYRTVVTCTASASSANTASFLVNVMSPVALPYTEDFESITANNQLPGCMQATNLNGKTFTYIAATGSDNQTNHTPGGSKFASFKWSSHDYFYTPAFNLTAGQTYQFSFWYITDGYSGWDTLSVNLGTSASAATMTTVIGTSIMSPTNTAYQQFIGTFTAPTTGVYNIGIYCGATSSPDYLSIDDINLAQFSACSGTPTSGTITGTSSICYNTPTQLALTGYGIASGLSYQWQSSPNGSTWTNISGATTTSYTTSSLTMNAYYRIVTTCAGSGLSANTASFLVNVTSPVALPYTEDFESITANNQLPGCMQATNLNSQTFTYLTATGSYNQTNHTAGGSKFASFKYSSHDYFYTPAFNLTAGQTYQFSFWYITDGYSGWDTLAVKLGTSASAATMTTVIGTSVLSPTNTAYQQFTGTFTAPGTGVYNVGVYCGATYSPDYLSIDDINLMQLPACSGTPTSGTVTGTSSICYNTSTQLALTGYGIASGISYQWQSSPNGSTWTNIPGATTTIYTTPSLTMTTYYRVVTTCAGSGLSANTASFLVNVTSPVALPYTENFESITANNQLPGCMQATNLNGKTFTYIAATGSYNQTNHTAGGSKFASFKYSCNDYFITPALNLTAGQTYQFSFWYITDGLTGWDTLAVKIRSAQTPGAGLPVGSALHGVTNTTYQQFTSTFTVPSTGVYNVGIYCKATSTPWYLSIDDINLAQATPMDIASNQAFGNNIDVYPNPSMGKVNLHYTNTQNEAVSILVTNVEGRQVYAEQISDRGEVNKTIDLSNCANGVYFIRLVSGNEVTVRKVVIQQ